MTHKPHPGPSKPEWVKRMTPVATCPWCVWRAVGTQEQVDEAKEFHLRDVHKHRKEQPK